MDRHSALRFSVIISAAVAVCLSACTHTPQNNPPALKQADAKKQAALKQNRLLLLQAELKDRKNQVSADQKAIPRLLAQSDAALKQAQQFKRQQAALKDKKNAAVFQKRIDGAQRTADEQAAALVNTRQDLYAQFDAVADLQKQISALSGKDQAAKSLVAGKTGHDGSHKQPASLAHGRSGSHM